MAVGRFPAGARVALSAIALLLGCALQALPVVAQEALVGALPDSAPLAESELEPDPPQSEAPQAEDEEALEETAAREAAMAAASAANPGAAAAAERTTGAMVTEAEGLRASAAGLEARVAGAEAKSANLLANASMGLRGARQSAEFLAAAKSQLAASAKRTAEFARSAEEAAAQARADLREVQEAPRKAAEEAAQVAAQELRQRAKIWRAGDAALQAKVEALIPPPASEAGERVALPYRDAARRSAVASASYELRGRTLDELAGSLQEGVGVLDGEAQTSEEEGEEDVARRMRGRAGDLLRRAVKAGAQAQENYKASARIRSDIPTYEASASAAEAHASALSRQYWMPPPPVAAGAPAAAPPPVAATDTVLLVPKALLQRRLGEIGLAPP